MTKPLRASSTVQALSCVVVMDDRTLASLDPHTRHRTPCIGEARRRTGCSPGNHAARAGPKPLPGLSETGSRSRNRYRAIVVPDARLPRHPDLLHCRRPVHDRRDDGMQGFAAMALCVTGFLCVRGTLC